MNIYLPLLTRRFLAAKFSALRMRALSDLFRNMRSGSKSAPEIFPGKSQRIRSAASLKWIGLENIRVADITGTFEHQTDFDEQFRPLQKNARERWINAYIRFMKNGWSPILVHKVGDQYFVDDGQYRVSVARFLGIEFITAEVWEYDDVHDAEPCPDWPCQETISAKVYAVR
ncbi:MAG: hypothetical protein QM730_27270 [Anaerolineales bacterium]